MTSRDRALSPLVGGVLVVGIVVLLAAVVATMALGFEDALVDPGPTVASGNTVRVELSGGEVDHSLALLHRAGATVDADALTVRVGSGDASVEYPLSSIDSPALADGRWGPGERVALDLDAETVCAGGGETAHVSVVHDAGRQSFLVSHREVPIERGQFVVRDTEVVPTARYTAAVTFVGTAWSSPYYDPPVTVRVTVGDEPVHSWTGVHDAQSTVGTYDVSTREAGTSLAVSASGYDGWDWRNVSESRHPSHMRVLRDGDPVPNLDAGDGQQSVAGYVSPYVKGDRVSLADNQAIFLFDFNTNTPASAVDYQDAVVLVSFFTQEETVQFRENRRGEDVVVCPGG
ncbi:type IV pilin [Halomarina pelagica]|uniref:type IV pilin n=1 Tax=Halomarina pelagica TaxID=2961599 RepID=UPI0020C4A142|nr:type IV pilin [Halomarina sp. BND7]